MDLELHQVELKYKGMRILYAGQQSQLMSSLSEHGQHSPVLVVEAARDRYVLIDGYKRVEAFGRLGRDTVEALVLQMNELEALVFSHRQQNARPREALEDGWLIRELMEGHGLSMEEVAARLGRTRSWVSRRLGLVKALPSEVQELVRVGRLCPYAAARFLVPLARANTEHCIRLAAGIGGKRLSASQVASNAPATIWPSTPIFHKPAVKVMSNPAEHSRSGTIAVTTEAHLSGLSNAPSTMLR